MRARVNRASSTFLRVALALVAAWSAACTKALPSEFADAENDSDSAGSPHDMTNMASTHDDATADPLEGKASRIAPR